MKLFIIILLALTIPTFAQSGLTVSRSGSLTMKKFN